MIYLCIIVSLSFCSSQIKKRNFKSSELLTCNLKWPMLHELYYFFSLYSIWFMFVCFSTFFFFFPELFHLFTHNTMYSIPFWWLENVCENSSPWLSGTALDNSVFLLFNLHYCVFSLRKKKTETTNQQKSVLKTKRTLL